MIDDEVAREALALLGTAAAMLVEDAPTADEPASNDRSGACPCRDLA
jgi:hypothetical protein